MLLSVTHVLFINQFIGFKLSVFHVVINASGLFAINVDAEHVVNVIFPSTTLNKELGDDDIPSIQLDHRSFESVHVFIAPL